MPQPFDPGRIFETLRRHQVRYVLIGGWAARLLGSPTVTVDIDITYARDPQNLERLAQALRELGASLRGAAQILPFRLDARTLALGANFTFTTDAGDLDILAEPAGAPDYEALERTAQPMELGDFQILVASVDDLIAMKRAAGRPKDRIELVVLGALREEMERAGES
ncbi:MAG: nucleotidyl transferase AbiEii/AbiGii toxin family protein [Chloroflexota bacterium]|nr:nucleotidyl transferase AbiEii/AbiGii toxin family protein [Chloroflexota bacterium]